MQRVLLAVRPVAPNNSFKPNLLRYTKHMAERSCHVFGSTTQVGLTQALGLMFKSNRIPKIALLVLLLAFAYLAVLILLGQERAMDWGLSSEEMYLHEKLLSL